MLSILSLSTNEKKKKKKHEQEKPPSRRFHSKYKVRKNRKKEKEVNPIDTDIRGDNVQYPFSN
jgi:hypothetical protein